MLDRYIKDLQVVMPQYCESVLQIFNEDNKELKYDDSYTSEISNETFNQSQNKTDSENIVPRISIRGN